MSSKRKKDNSLSKFSMFFGFSLLALYISLNNDMFYYKFVRLPILFISIVIGFFGMVDATVTLIGSYLEQNEIDGSNLGVGVVLLIFLWLIQYIVVKNPILIVMKDLLFSFVLLLALTSTFDGLIKVGKLFTRSEFRLSIYSFITSFLKVMITLVGLISSIVSILVTLRLV